MPIDREGIRNCAFALVFRAMYVLEDGLGEEAIFAGAPGLGVSFLAIADS
jgi:hypothetical protein